MILKYKDAKGVMMGFAYVNISDKMKPPVCLSIFVSAIIKYLV